MAEHMLTTVDNPFSPVTNYDEWYVWDQRAGYNTPGLLASFVKTSDAMSFADQSLAIEIAIDTIVDLNPLGVHRKVVVDS